MEPVSVFIERTGGAEYYGYGKYCASMSYVEELPFRSTGNGNTVEETKQDFLNSVEAVKEEFAEEGIPLPEDLRFEFFYDVPSFLAYYSGKLTLAGLERITGVARGQLSRYVTGRRNPSQRTVEKIEKAINKFGEDLSHVNLLY